MCMHPAVKALAAQRQCMWLADPQNSEALHVVGRRCHADD